MSDYERGMRAVAGERERDELRATVSRLQKELEEARESYRRLMDGTVSNEVHDKRLAIERGWREKAEASASRLQAENAKLREVLEGYLSEPSLVAKLQHGRASRREVNLEKAARAALEGSNDRG